MRLGLKVPFTCASHQTHYQTKMVLAERRYGIARFIYIRLFFSHLAIWSRTKRRSDPISTNDELMKC